MFYMKYDNKAFFLIGLIKFLEMLRENLDQSTTIEKNFHS